MTAGEQANNRVLFVIICWHRETNEGLISRPQFPQMSTLTCFCPPSREEATSFNRTIKEHKSSNLFSDG